MANYYRNDLYIRGSDSELQRFQRDAMPRPGEECNGSWSGHGEGSLSFLSLLPPPDELRVPKANWQEVEAWRNRHWGCAFPEVDDCTLKDDCLHYYFVSRHFCAHNFVVEVSKVYPDLAFTLLWNDVNSGSYGEPMDMALLAVQNGIITMDYVEMEWETVLALEAELPPLHKLTEVKRQAIRKRIEKEKNWVQELAQDGHGGDVKDGQTVICAADEPANTAKATAENGKVEASTPTSVPSDAIPGRNTDESEDGDARMF